MRELKFRCWNNCTRKYIPENELMENFAEYLGEDHLYIEQYTGLNDKNGKEICEGDIVNYSDGCICVVQYEDEGARFIHRDISDDFPFGFNRLEEYDGEEYDGELFEVIGNTHENPELLGGEG